VYVCLYVCMFTYNSGTAGEIVPGIFLGAKNLGEVMGRGHKIGIFRFLLHRLARHVRHPSL